MLVRGGSEITYPPLREGSNCYSNFIVLETILDDDDDDGEAA